MTIETPFDVAEVEELTNRNKCCPAVANSTSCGLVIYGTKFETPRRTYCAEDSLHTNWLKLHVVQRLECQKNFSH